MSLRNPHLYNQQKYEPEENRRTFSVLSFFKLLFLLVILVGIAYLLFFTHYFAVQEIMVKSQNTADQEKVKAIVEQNLSANRNVFLFSTANAKKAIADQIENIREVNIYRGLPHTLQVVITEREPAIIWQTSGYYYLIDKQGVAYRQVDKKTDYPTVLDQKDLKVEIGQKILTADFIDFIVPLPGKLKDKNNLVISEISVPVSVMEIHVKVDKGYTIYLATDRSLDQQLDNLNQVLKLIADSPVSYIDLRVPGRAYYQ